jgi:hypothetical protein
MSDRQTVLSLLVTLSMITYLDRLCIAIAGPRMQAELGISPEHWVGCWGHLCSPLSFSSSPLAPYATELVSE